MRLPGGVGAEYPEDDPATSRPTRHALRGVWAGRGALLGGDAGSGALGQGLAAFVWAPVAFFDVDMDALHGLEAAAWSRYLDRLRDGGWRGEPSAVRLGYTADVALRSMFTAWICGTWLPD